MFALSQGRLRLSLSLALVAAVLVAATSAQAQFNPPRTFPDTTSTIGVFVDQLPGGMTAAQDQFAATHYAGTQKLTTNLIDPIRAYNPDFLMLQYRVGVLEGGDTVSFIHNNAWSTPGINGTGDWATINTHEDWFVHVTGNNTASGRLYEMYGSIKEWIMDVGGTINGNTTDGWKQFWASETMADAAASHADGTFADVCLLPWAPYTNNSPLGPAPCTAFIPDLEAFYSYVYQQYQANNMYFIPNVGTLTTYADTTQGYYTNVSGAMTEGFAVKTSDWTLQQNRILQLLNNGKVWIAQNYLNSNSDVATREWYLTNYLLLKSSKSFINIPTTDSELYWWPEYNIQLGAPKDALPTNISAYALASGLYLRHYQNGIVIVNPTGSALTYTFAANDPRNLVAFSGGGDVDANGNLPASSLTYTLQSGGTFSIPAWSGEIFMVPEPGSLCLLAAGAWALIRRRK